ncbi:NAD(P)H-quinone oxidoreductase subunit I, partial [Prochlorococcus sp. AH-716-P20]|nr:NAD(P)H-quinone oxidoreductase subunit I [Prochlorococcus sp. AH-716-P20]
GVMDPHEVPPSDVRVGKLPEEVYDWMKPELNDIKNPTVETNK